MRILNITVIAFVALTVGQLGVAYGNERFGREVDEQMRIRPEAKSAYGDVTRLAELKKEKFGREAESKKEKFGREARGEKEKFGREAESKKEKFGREVGSEKEKFGREAESKKEKFGREAEHQNEKFGREATSADAATASPPGNKLSK